MRKVGVVLLFASWLLGVGAHAQNGFTAILPQHPNQWVRLYAYTGLDEVLVDSLQGDDNGRISYAPTLPQGMYYLQADDAVVEFLSLGEPGLTLDSPDNLVWTAYLADKEQADSLAALPTRYASKLIRVDRPRHLKTFYQEVDFNDTTLIPTNVLTTRIIEYLMTSRNFVTAVDTLCCKAKVNMKMYEFVLQYLLKGFTAMGLDEVTDHLLNFPCIAEGEIDAAQGERLEALTAPYQKVRVGAKAPDVEGVDLEGNPYRLYESKANRIILCFWSVDCEYCHDFLMAIRKHLDLKNDYELVTFALADSREEVVKEVRKLRLPGHHFYDEARWEGKAFLDYHLVSTPTVFMLDADKVIVAKPYDWNELKNALKGDNR